jgi:hypothetical protein
LEISHDSGLFARFSEPVAKRIQQLAADTLFLLKQRILLSEQGFLSPEQGIPTLLSFQSLDFIAAARFDLRAASRREFVPAYDRKSPPPYCFSTEDVSTSISAYSYFVKLIPIL